MIQLLGVRGGVGTRAGDKERDKERAQGLLLSPFWGVSVVFSVSRSGEDPESGVLSFRNSSVIHTGMAGEDLSRDWSCECPSSACILEPWLIAGNDPRKTCP